jgi:hypothetical protein
MQVITNVKLLTAVTGGEDVFPDDTQSTMNSVCYEPGEASCYSGSGAPIGSTNTSHATAGTDSEYYGANPTQYQQAQLTTGACSLQGSMVGVVAGIVAGVAVSAATDSAKGGTISGTLASTAVGAIATSNCNSVAGRR